MTGAALRPIATQGRSHRIGVGAGLPANAVVAATLNGRWRLASRPGLFAGEPAPTTTAMGVHRFSLGGRGDPVGATVLLNS